MTKPLGEILRDLERDLTDTQLLASHSTVFILSFRHVNL